MKKILMILGLVSLQISIANADTAYTGIRENITGIELTVDMGVGLNLYNTLDAHCNYREGLATETCWQGEGVYTTSEMIDDFADRGFKTLRVPVTWKQHMGPAPDFTIDLEWMDRVEEIANYAFANDMYVIINIHHDDLKEDSGWLSPTYEHKEQSITQIEKVWTQIATRFKDYGDYLIFETMNEPREVGSAKEWSGGSEENRDMVNQLNLAAVNAIRATGGNNASRFIMVPQNAANGVAAMESLIIPNDDERILVSIHNYNPFFFTLGEGVKTFGTPKEIANLRDEFKAYYDAFVSKGQAVVLGEWGAGDKDNLASRVTYYEVVAAACKLYNITPITWIFDYERTTRTWKTPEIIDAIITPSSDVLEFPPVSVPSKIEAESFVAQSGVQIKNDDDKGSIVAFIENDDFIEFKLDVSESDEYQFEFEVSSGTAGGTIEILIDGVVVNDINVASTGGWNEWTSVTSSIDLGAGTQVIRLVFKGASGYLFNIDWFDITQTVTEQETPAPTPQPTPEPTPTNNGSSGGGALNGVYLGIMFAAMFLARLGLNISRFDVSSCVWARITRKFS